MTNFQKFKDDIQNGIIKAIELIDINSCSDRTWKEYSKTSDKRQFTETVGLSVIRNNVHALIFNCPMAVVGYNDNNYYLKYYSKDKSCFLTNEVPYPNEQFYKENDCSFNYDGNYLEYQNEDSYKRYKVHKNMTYYVKEN